MMKVLEYLFYKYYKFQVKFGNGDIAPFSSALMLALTFYFYFFAFSFFTIIFFTKEQLIKINIEFKTFSFLLLFTLFILFYFLFVHKGKHKKIMKRKDLENKSNISAIIFLLLAFILLILSMYLKMLQNQGRI